jgi:Ca2+-binding RTX toxin-like protein
LNGRSGDDTLSGGGGLDSLTGDTGADVFLFDSALNTSPTARNVDVIVDFKRAESDKLYLDLSIFAQAGTANMALNAGAFVVNTTGMSVDADDRIIYNSNDGNLYYDPNGNGGASILFARIGSVSGVRPMLQYDDFFLVP